MKKSIREIAIRRIGIVPIKSGGVKSPLNASVLASSLAEIGFRIVDLEEYNDNFLDTYPDDLLVLKKMRGEHVDHVPLFANFPDKIPDYSDNLVKRIAGFVLNLGGYVSEDDGVSLDNGMIIPKWLFDLDDYNGDPILGRQDESLFKSGVKAENNKKGDNHTEWFDLEILREELAEEKVLGWALDSMYAKSSIKQSYREDIEEILSVYGANFINPEGVSFKETKAYLTEYFWNKEQYSHATHIMSSPTDILRMFASITNGDSSLNEPLTFPKLKRSARREILSAIDSFDNPVLDMNRYRGLWISLGNILHPGEYKNRYSNAAEAFDTIRNKKVRTFYSLVQSKIDKGDVLGAANLLKKRPGEFGRKIHHMLEISGDDWPKIMSKFKEVAHNIKIKNLMVLQSYFRTIEASNYKTIINKKGRIIVLDNKKGRISKACNEEINSVISSSIKKAMQNKASWESKSVYVEPALRNYMIPLSERNASDGFMTLARGTRVEVDSEKTIRFFCYWKQSEITTDLDLSVISYDDKMNKIGHVSYTQLQNGGMVHSGDITSAPNGASEFIDIPIQKARQMDDRIRYIAMQVYIYRGENFSALDESFCGWMVRDEPTNNSKSFDPKTVQSKFEVRGAGKYAIPCMLDLKTGQIVYVDLYMRGVSQFNRVEEAHQDIGLVTREVANMYNTKPNMFNLSVENAIGRGANLVQEKKDADISIGIKNCTFNILDTEKVLTELI